MKSLKWQLKKILALCIVLWITSTTFADNVIGDVPSSSNENRTINRETSLYNWTCDLSQDLAFYSWSPVYLRVGQPKWPVSYVFDKTETYVRAYNQTLFAGTLKFPYVSNFVPSTTIDSDSSNILTVDATGATFLWSTTIARNQPAWQFVTFNNERSIVQNANGALLNYYYVRANDLSLHNGSLNVIINPNLTTKISCTNYYVARCGDGVVDKETGTSDGNWWLTTQWWTFLPWHTISIKPNEACDDWAENGQAGKCKTDCTGIWGWTETGNLIVTKTLTVDQNYTPGQNVQFRINISNPSTQTVQNIAIEDYFLPNGFEYISSQIEGVTGSTYFSTGTNVSWNFQILYTGFSLAAGQNWYILIDAKFLSCNDWWNHVFWSATSNWINLNWYTNKQVTCSTTPVSITKIATPNSIQAWQIVWFTITVNNSTPSTVTNVRVEDVWPTCFSLISWSAQTSLPATQTNNGNLTQWTLSSGLPAGQTFTVTFSGQSSISCNLWSHSNIGRVIFTDAQWIQQQQTTANVTITQTTARMEITKEVDGDNTAGPGDDVEFIIRYRNIWTTPINWFRIIDHRPNALQFRSSILESTNQNINPININTTPLVWNFLTTVLQPGEWDAIRVIWIIKADLQ